MSILILDSSGSMWAQLPEGRSRIEVARDVLDDFLRARPAQAPLGVISYGHTRKGDCTDIAVIAPVATQDGAALGARLRGLSPKGKTPIADALRLAASQIPNTAEEVDIVLITDGLETCGGDPCAVAAELAQSGIPLRAHVVGFGLTEGEVQQIACVAAQTGGLVLSTQSGAELSDALIRTTSTQATPPPAAPGVAALQLTIRADIAGRPDRVAFRAVNETSGESVDFGTLDFTLADSLGVSMTAGNWLITADGGDSGNGELVASIAEGDNRTLYIPFRGLLPTLDMTPPVGAMRAGASGIFPHRITNEGLAVGGADFQLTLLPADATALTDRPLTWSAQDGNKGAYVSRLSLPADPGTYLVAYHRYGETDLDNALARFPLMIEVRPQVTLIAPEAVAPGQSIPVTVTGGMAHADRLEVWKDGQLYSWDQSRYLEQLFDSGYGPATPLLAPSEPGSYELVYVFSDLGEPDNVAARQPLQVGADLEFDDAALTPCADDTRCGTGEEALVPGGGVVAVRILAQGIGDQPVEWFAQPIGREGALAIASDGVVTGAWDTRLDVGDWALTGLADGATFFLQITVSEDGPTDFTLTRDMPLADPPAADTAPQPPAGDYAFVCTEPFQCVFEDTRIGIIAVIPSHWAVDAVTREPATAQGERGAVRMTVFDPATPDNALILNPRQWVAANGPCHDVQPGLLCHFAPASPQTLAALDLTRRTLRDTQPRNQPGPAEALSQALGEIAKSDPNAAAMIETMLGAAAGASGDEGPTLGGILGGVLGGAPDSGSPQSGAAGIPALPTPDTALQADQFDLLRQQLTSN